MHSIPSTKQGRLHKIDAGNELDLDRHSKILSLINASDNKSLGKYLSTLKPEQRHRIIADTIREYDESNLLMQAIEAENPDALSLLLDAVPAKDRYKLVLSERTDNFGEPFSDEIIETLFDKSPINFLPIILEKLPPEDCIKLLNHEIDDLEEGNKQSVLKKIIQSCPEILPTVFEKIPLEFHPQILDSVQPHGLFPALIENESIEIIGELAPKMTPSDFRDAIIAGGSHSAILYFIKKQPDLIASSLEDARAPGNLLDAIIHAMVHDMSAVLKYAAAKKPHLLAPLFKNLTSVQLPDAISHLGGIHSILDIGIQKNPELLAILLPKVTSAQFAEMLAVVKEIPAGAQANFLISCTNEQYAEAVSKLKLLIPPDHLSETARENKKNAQEAHDYSRGIYKQGLKSSNKLLPGESLLSGRHQEVIIKIVQLRNKNQNHTDIDLVTDEVINSEAHNCGEATLIARAYIRDHNGAACEISLPHLHTFLSVGVVDPHHLGSDLTQSPQELYFTDPWINETGPLHQYPFLFIRKMHKWTQEGKRIYVRELGSWISPNNKEWMRMCINGQKILRYPVVGKHTLPSICSELCHYLNNDAGTPQKLCDQLRMIPNKQLSDTLQQGFHDAMKQACQSPNQLPGILTRYANILKNSLRPDGISYLLHDLFATAPVLRVVASNPDAWQAYSQLVDLIPSNHRAGILFANPKVFTELLGEKPPQEILKPDQSYVPMEKAGFRDLLNRLTKANQDKFLISRRKEIMAGLQAVSMIQPTPRRAQEALLELRDKLSKLLYEQFPKPLPPNASKNPSEK